MTSPEPASAPPIRRLLGAEARTRAGELADILLDCVAGGASVSFMAGTTREQALAFWGRIADAVEEDGRILLVAEEAGTLVGTAQVAPAGMPNQPHRADLGKMLVHRAARGRGLGAALLAAAETASLQAGWWLLVLDTVVDSEGDSLYTRCGWTPVGIIPNYALWPDGRLCATKYFYKDLRSASPPPERPSKPA